MSSSTVLCSFLFLAASAVLPAKTVSTHLADLDLSGLKQGHARPTTNIGLLGNPLRVGGREFAEGIATHAASTWTLNLDGQASEFRALVGVQEYLDNPGVGSVEFVVRGDGKELWKSGLLRGGQPAREVKVSLTGVRTLSLEVTDGGDGQTSDHADWLEPVIVHQGSPLPPAAPDPFAAERVPDQAGDPADAPATVRWDKQKGSLRLDYDGKAILEGRVTGPAELVDSPERTKGLLTQTIVLTGNHIQLQATVSGDAQTIAAETRGPAQDRFPLIRTTNGGPSANLRNNALFSRHRDWLLSASPEGTRIEPDSSGLFRLTASGNRIELTFRPRYYQRHRNIGWFRPWTYAVRTDSITGWSSWWAYMRNFSQRDLDQLLAVWKEKRFADFGYRFVQIDDCYQGGEHGGRRLLSGTGYPGGHPETWLQWRKELFPGGLTGYSASVRQAGFEPGVWIGSHFGDLDIVDKHPDWFVGAADGKPFAGPWIGLALDATNPAAAEAMIKPTYRGMHQAGMSYVKIDILRHYLYDNLNKNPEFCRQRHTTPAEVLRAYLAAARRELGPDTFILSCWGVLPESVGLADACRIGGDGYGPSTMQQYNSWNGIVWRNDPDHCDVLPNKKGAEAGNVSRTTAVKAAPQDTIIRPALASIAGCLLMLSDKPSVYQDDTNLEGLRRSSPVLFSVPGQLYDFDPRKSDNLKRVPRSSITSGANPSPIDADQFGAVCPWWLNEIVRPFERWNVLHRLNWSGQESPATEVALKDLGLPEEKSFLVYEFWSKKFLGVCRDRIALASLPPMGLQSLALREGTDHPQVLSTSRHLSQGGVDLVSVEWKDNRLAGRSRVVAGDRYEIVLHVPGGCRCTEAMINGKPAEVASEGEIVRFSFVPSATGEVPWSTRFDPGK